MFIIQFPNFISLFVDPYLGVLISALGGLILALGVIS